MNFLKPIHSYGMNQIHCSMIIHSFFKHHYIAGANGEHELKTATRPIRPTRPTRPTRHTRPIRPT